MSLAQRMRSSHLARSRCLTSRPGSRPLLVLVAKAVSRYPPTSSKRSRAPGWGLSRRMITRMPSGRPDRSSRSVISATSAPSLGSPSALRAGAQAVLGIFA